MHRDSTLRRLSVLIMTDALKVVSANLGRNTNYHIHPIIPHDPVAAAALPPKHVSVGSLCTEIEHKNQWYYRPLKTRITSIATNY